MNVQTPIAEARDRKADFPGLAMPDGAPWHYLDSAATAQKPQVVIDAVTRAIGVDYATVHRGVYSRSAEMTLGYEAARRRVASFVGGQEDELVFTRGATEAINLVAYTWGAVNLGKGDRILLSELEHHSNIVPWQIMQRQLGFAIDVCPLTEDGRIDLNAAERMLTRNHKLVALAHVSNVLGSVLDARRAADLAHSVGAKLLLDGCQAVPRLPVDVGALDCDFYAFSAHKLYGPTGVGALWARADILADMPPWQGGGAMIDKVSFEGTSFAPAPQRFEAGTPAIVEAIGFGVACDYVTQIGLEAIHAHETELVARTREALRAMNDVTLFGPDDAAGIVSFAIRDIHPHDLGTILDEENVAIRAGHHCAQPLMERLGVPATARASFGLYSDADDVCRIAARDRSREEDFRLMDEHLDKTDMNAAEAKDYVAAPAPNEDIVPAKPPRARVSDAPLDDAPDGESAGDKLARKRDYLDGFLQQKPQDTVPGAPGGELYESVIEALKDIYDPEIPVNIYELGLIYGVDVSEEADVAITMTLTTPHCPVAETMPGEIEMRVMNLPGVRDAEVNVTWDPPWDPSKMSDEARLELGML